MTDHHHHPSGECDTTGRHGMLLFGAGPVYLSHLPMYHCPHHFQVLLEAELPPGVLEKVTGDGLFTFDPDPFPIAELGPHDGPARTTLTGTVFRGHFERGGTPIAKGVRVTVRRVVWFRDIEDAAASGGGLPYLCFGRGEQVFLAHELTTRPNFDQVLAVRFVPGTVRTQVGHPLDDDVAELRFDQAQPVTFGRDDGIDRRLHAGEVATGSFALTRSPSFSRGFTVGVEVERELYLEIDELA
ncbi:hypothetical protein GCM10010168_68630 [Actinoplanes ianthinogenes]|uniref:Acetoacetate decarboxylase n=1 Tax=Actinoplanes ianthinogenes TaxID=122358 RepID=A0ABM7M0I6_9ACTN|nr:hypothetical protein [Actinoplanes ianthinogenes]BCJ45063.1 hypothetical protein Aiant_57200 [Actinoplanes ianthinogenes]GGR40315.1 hypothetical protein GCM10010168_68630 [Actinoplanes ianthinogenes]